jgi:hypothetical protein
MWLKLDLAHLITSARQGATPDLAVWHSSFILQTTYSPHKIEAARSIQHIMWASARTCLMRVTFIKSLFGSTNTAQQIPKRDYPEKLSKQWEIDQIFNWPLIGNPGRHAWSMTPAKVAEIAFPLFWSVLKRIWFGNGLRNTKRNNMMSIYTYLTIKMMY